LVASYAVPTAPIALYSDKHNSLEDIKDGMKITLPNDPTNLARSLHMLVDFGWVTIDDSVKQTTASEKDIIDNPYNLDVQPIEAAQTPRSLSDADFAFINGNFALAADLKLTDSVAIEDTPEDYLIYVTLRNGEENEPFAKALEKAYKSVAFLDYTNEHAQGYVKPPYQNELEEKIVIRIEHVTKTYDDVIAVDDVSFNIKKGEIFGIIGYSGAGKSTLLRCLNLLERPTTGKVWIDNKDFTKLTDREVRKERLKVGMIFQHFYLISSKTVYD